MLYEEEIRSLLTYYEELEKKFKSDMEGSPSGGILWQNNKGYDQFLHVYHNGNKRIRRGINKNKKLQRELARKEFARRSLEVITPNVENLRTALNSIIPYDPDQLLKSMNKGYGLLPEEYFFDRSEVCVDAHLNDEIKSRIERHREWGKMAYQQSTYMEEYNEELFYWEHLGMMDYPDYAKRNYRKLERYYDAGLIPGDNLILTFDRKGTINMAMIEAIIINEVIPRL